MKRAIVSGSAGFLGSHLVKRLETEGYKVIGWDITEGNDVCNPNLTAKKVEAVFHLACPVNPAHYQSVAIPTLMASSIGTYNMLEIARKNNAKFLYVSSSEVYGDLGTYPFKESDLVIVDPRGVRTFYDISKLFGEVLTMTYNRYHDLDVRIIRPFNIYGPGMRKDDNRVIPSFIRNMKEGKPVHITGNGEATRTFCFVDDFIEGVMRAMFYSNTNGEVFNFGTDRVVSMNQLAEILKAEVYYVDARESEQKNRLPDISKAKSILQWEPTTTLEEGMEKMWKSYP